MSEETKDKSKKAGLNLSRLATKPGNKSRKRLGRGPGSGWGKTSGKGQKGQKARSGGAPPPLFEGGQLPLHRRVPKLKGFKPRPKAPVLAVNLQRLESSTLNDISIPTLIEAGIVKIKKSQKYYRLKVLGYGDISRPLTIQCHAISEGAKVKVEKAGGKVEILEDVFRNGKTAEAKSA